MFINNDRPMVLCSDNLIVLFPFGGFSTKINSLMQMQTKRVDIFTVTSTRTRMSKIWKNYARNNEY